MPHNHDPAQMTAMLAKAETLVEALPYLQRYAGRTFVVKYGGHAMIDDALKASFAQDVVLLRHVGIQLVVVHGGGPQIDAALSRMGVKYTQPSAEVRDKLRADYANNADSLTAASQVIAINFQTVAAANNYWR